MLCVSLIPISPLPGKDIFEYKEKLGILCVILAYCSIGSILFGFSNILDLHNPRATSAILLPFMIV